MTSKTVRSKPKSVLLANSEEKRLSKKVAHNLSPHYLGNPYLDSMDPIHAQFDLFGKDMHPFNRMIWENKYRWDLEASPLQTFERVAKAIYQYDGHAHAQEAYYATAAGLWMPGGRIIAGAGTTKRVTLLNCYVNRTLDDALPSIMASLEDAALTQQMGGGIGTDFSPLRPSGAFLQRTQSKASGPLPFMDMFHSMCQTIESAGERRGAMMGTLCDTHPDLPKFIVAKQTKDRMTNFNVSVLVSDAFMSAVAEDADWDLYFSVPRGDNFQEALGSFVDENNITQYIYETWKARDLWELITRNTYEWSEPGVIFIDRINSINNLKYCELIRCTNPCGEQPLPPFGCCDLGSVNWARLILKPFTAEASFDFVTFKKLVALGVRFLDNVIDVTEYPLETQHEEQLNKRRIGIGDSGVGDALAQLGLRYGSRAALDFIDRVKEAMCQQAYRTSAELAKERGSFRLFKANEYLTDSFASQRVDFDIQTMIRDTGIRNGVLLTNAPTGTTTIFYGNMDSGIEPNFQHRGKRNVRQSDNTLKAHDYKSYTLTIWERLFDEKELPSSMVSVEDLTIEDHITTQATVQRWVDASVSKTVNLAKETSYEEFVKVYDLAYRLGCKGCTTYRPSDVRGSILIKDGEAKTEQGAEVAKEELLPRPDILQGLTHKIKWPQMGAAIYMTVNYDSEGFPFELFFATKDGKHHDWMTTVSILITSILRRRGDIRYIAAELLQVHSFGDHAFMQAPGDDKPRFYGSLPAYIGAVLGDYLHPRRAYVGHSGTEEIHVPFISTVGFGKEVCPSCHQATLEYKEGCKTCQCGYSNCG